MHRAVHLVAASLLLTACSEARSAAPPVDPSDGPPPDAADISGTWTLAGIAQDGKNLLLPDDVAGILEVDASRLGGFDLCNSWASGYRLDNGALLLVDDMSTTVGCSGLLGEAATAYVQAFSAADADVAMEDGVLVVTGESVALRFRAVPPVQANDSPARRGSWSRRTPTTSRVPRPRLLSWTSMPTGR